METAAQVITRSTAPARVPRILLWLATLLLSLPLLAAGMPKLLGQGGWVTAFAHWGFPSWFVPVVGVAEVVGATLMFVPRIATVGASMIAVVMAGAAMTHALHDEMPRVAFTSMLCLLAMLIAWSRRRDFSIIGSR